MVNKEVSIVIRAVDNATKGLKNVSGELSNFAKKHQRSFQKMAAVGTVAFAGIAAGVNSMTQEAAIAEGTWNKFNTVFGEGSEDMRAFIDDIRKEMPSATHEIARMGADLQDLLVPMGLARGEAQDLTKGFLDVANKVAAFNDVDPTQVLEAFKSGLSGSSEPLRRFGINALDSSLELEAMNTGLLEAGQKMSDLDPITRSQVKAQALLTLSVKQSADAIDGFEANNDSLIRRQQDLQANFKELSATLGATFVPILDSVVKKLLPIVQSISERVEENPILARNIVIAAGAIAGLVAVLGTVGLVLPSIITGVTALVAVLSGPVGLVLGISAAILALDRRAHKSKTNQEVIEYHRDAIRQLSEDYKAGEISVDEYNQGLEHHAEYIKEATEKSNKFSTHLRDDLITALRGPRKAIEGLVRVVQQMIGGIKFLIEVSKLYIVFLKDSFKQTLELITGIFNTMVDTAKMRGSNLVGMFIDGMKAKFPSLSSSVGEAASIIKNFLGFSSPTKEGPASDSDKWIPNFISMLVDGFRNGESYLKEAAGSLAGQINAGLEKTTEFLRDIQFQAQMAFSTLASQITGQENKINSLVQEYRDLEDQLESLNQTINDIEGRGQENVAQRAIQIEQEMARIKEEMLASDDASLGVQLEKLKAELELAKANTTQTELQKQRELSQMNETELILHRMNIERQNVEDQMELVRVQMEAKKQEMRDEYDLYQSLVEQKTELDKAYFLFFGEKISAQQKSIQQTISLMQQLASMSGGGYGGGGVDGQRQFGGTMLAGKSYLVGERGPEIVTPASTGMVSPLPNGSGMNISINMGGVTVQNEADEQRLAQTIQDTIQRQLELYKLGSN